MSENLKKRKDAVFVYKEYLTALCTARESGRRSRIARAEEDLETVTRALKKIGFTRIEIRTIDAEVFRKRAHAFEIYPELKGLTLFTETIH